MDWASLYPAYAVEAKSHDIDEKEQSTKVTALSKNVEIADIGCGFGGLIFALAPKFPDTLILGALLRLYDLLIHDTYAMSLAAVLTANQAWRLECQSQSMCKKKYAPCVSRMPQLAPTKMRPAFARTR